MITVYLQGKEGERGEGSRAGIVSRGMKTILAGVIHVMAKGFLVKGGREWKLQTGKGGH